MKTIIKGVAATLCLSWILPIFVVDAAAETAPTIENMRYGKYKENVMDIYLVDSATPVPLAIFIHGGGFKSGTKTQVDDTDVKETLLAAGISVATRDYRVTSDKEYTLDQILREDMTLAVQMLRHRAASLNIDPAHFAAWGNSAGAGAALYLGVADDIADPTNTDPVRRQSSKIQVVGHLAGQSTYDTTQWASIVDVDPNWAELSEFEDDLYWFNVDSRDQITPEMYAKVDIAALFTADDAAIYSEKTPDRYGTDAGPINLDFDSIVDDDEREEAKRAARVLIAHSSKHALFIGEHCTAVGLTCEIITTIEPGPKRELSDFMIEQLLPTP